MKSKQNLREMHATKAIWTALHSLAFGVLLNQGAQRNWQEHESVSEKVGGSAMKRTNWRKRVTASALAVILSVGLMPSAAFAELSPFNEGSSEALTAASGEQSATSEDLQAAGTAPIDSGITFAIDDSESETSAESAGEQDDAASASSEEGEADVSEYAAAEGANGIDAATAGENGDAANDSESAAQSTNPFKAGVDAQPLADLENYYGRNHDADFKAKAWKTSVGCTGKKMWVGTVCNDDGFFAPGTKEPSLDYSGPTTSEYDAEVYAYIEKDYTDTVDGQPRDVIFVYGDCGLSSVDFSQLFDGTYDVYIPFYGFKDTKITTITFPSFIKELGGYSFYKYLNQGLSSITFETDDQGNGIQRLCSGAFTNNSNLSKQEQIIIPSSIKYLESGVFSEHDGTVNVTVNNPDVRFGNESTEEGTVKNPFAGGGTVTAYRYKSDGTSASDAWLLSQSEDAGNITWNWLDHGVKLSGTLALPDGMDASSVQISLVHNGRTTILTPETDGTFSYDDLLANKEAQLTITAPGYYGKTYIRLAQDMTTDWDMGTIDISAYTPIPAQQTFSIDASYDTGRTDSQGSPIHARITDWNSLSFELYLGETKLERGTVNNDGTITGDWAMQNGMLVLSPTLAETEGVPENLSLKASRGSSKSASVATAAFDKEANTFTVLFERWGSIRITTRPEEVTDDAFAGQAHVLVFAGTDDTAAKVADDFTLPTGMTENADEATGETETSWLYATDQLESGTYTVVAYDPTVVNISADTLGDARKWNFDFAQSSVQVKDGAETDVELAVPAFDKADLLSAFGISSFTTHTGENPICVGCETILSIEYELKTATNGLTLILGGIGDDTVSDLSITVDDQQLPWSTSSDGLRIKLPAGKTKGTLYFAFKPSKEQIYSLPISLEMQTASGTTSAQVDSISFAAFSAKVEVASGFVSQKANSATVYAAPYSTVQLSVDGKNIGRDTTTNELGRASIAFDLPDEVTENLLYGDGVKIDASIEPEGANSIQTYTRCTYRPSAELWTLKVTNDGTTQTLIDEGDRTDDYLVLHYQYPRARNAYWTFEVTIKNAGQEINASNTLMLYATMEDGRTEPVLLTKQPANGDTTYTRFAGEYVDEAYLTLLESTPPDSSGYFSTALLYAEGLFIPKTYSIDAFQLAFTTNLNDEEYQKRLAQRAQEETATDYAWLMNLFWPTGTAGNLIDEDTQQICTDTKAMLEGLANTLKAQKEDESLSEEDKQAIDDAIAEIEALAPDFDDPQTFLTDIDTETWMRRSEAELFASVFPDPVSYIAPSVDEIEDWYGSDTQAAQNAKDFFNAVSLAVSDNNHATQQAVRVTKNAAEQVGNALGVGSPTAAKTPSNLADANLESEGDLVIEQNAGTPSGEKVISTTKDTFTLDLYVDYNQKDDGKYSGYTVLISEQPPDQLQDQEARVTSYTANFDESHPYTDDALKDARTTALLSIAGGIVDALGESGESVTSTSLSITTSSPADASGNVASSAKKLSLAKNSTKVSLEKTTEAARAVVSTQKQAIETSAKASWIKENLKKYGELLPVVGTALNAYGLQNSCESWYKTSDTLGVLETEIENINQWILFWKQKNPCDSDCQRCIDALYAERDAAEEYKEILQKEDTHNYYDVIWGSITLHAGAAATILSMGTSDSAVHGVDAMGEVAGKLISKLSLATDISSTATHLQRAPWIDVAYNKYKEATAYRKSVCKQTGKESDEESEDEDEKNSGGKHNIDSSLVLDPSGNVYEALESNPVQGATATVWTKKASSSGEAVQEQEWNAAAYDQVNPQITGEDGAFAWDTPTGQYQVRVSKEGYEQAETEWLSVLPIQTGLKISLKSTVAPSIASSWAAPEYIELTFDQYMKADDGITATIDGEDAARIEWVDVQSASEKDGYGELSRTLRIYPSEDLEEFKTIDFSLHGAKNYVGTALGDESGAWSQQFVVRKRPASLVANYENAVTLQAGSRSEEVIAYVRYQDGSPAASQKVTASLASTDIASFANSASGSQPTSGAISVSATTDSEGKATFKLSGNLPGLTTLTLSIPGTSLSKELAVRVTSDVARPARPVAYIDGNSFNAAMPKENSVTVKAGSTLELLCSTTGATIYYTTDDTCPCKEDGTRVAYTGPVTVTKDTKFRITAYKEGMLYDNYSERLNLTITAVAEKGDVNGNGQVNIVDAQIAYDVATGKLSSDTQDYELYRKRSEVNEDGIIDAADAFAIQHAALFGW